MDNKYTHINLDYLNEMADNDIDFMREIIADYISKIPAYIEDLVQAVENVNQDNTVFFAHKLKSSFQFMGAKQLTSITEQIEQYAKEGSHQNEIPNMVKEILTGFERVIEELKTELERLG
jgi:HPt (histidine-containing phosphotransfer) domain-containing protein